MFKKTIEWLIALSIVIAIGFTMSKIYVAYGEYKKSAEATRLQEIKLNKLKMRVTKLNNEVQRLNTDHHYYEQLIRESLGWVKKGEKIFIIEEDSKKNSK